MRKFGYDIFHDVKTKVITAKLLKINILSGTQLVPLNNFDGTENGGG